MGTQTIVYFVSTGIDATGILPKFRFLYDTESLCLIVLFVDTSILSIQLYYCRPVLGLY